MLELDHPQLTIVQLMTSNFYNAVKEIAHSVETILQGLNLDHFPTSNMQCDPLW